MTRPPSDQEEANTAYQIAVYGGDLADRLMLAEMLDIPVSAFKLAHDQLAEE